jgi:hypothetical protein
MSRACYQVVGGRYIVGRIVLLLLETTIGIVPVTGWRVWNTTMYLSLSIKIVRKDSYELYSLRTACISCSLGDR